MSSFDNGQSTDRLDGWKDIAFYLGKSVRTAIRWEKQLGLPVRRLHTAGGEIVYAFRSEIDEWLRANPPSSRENGEIPAGVTAVQPAPVATTPAPETGIRRIETIGIIAVMVSAAALGFALAGFARRGAATAAPRDTNPAGYRFEPNTLVVTNKDGQELWRHQFDFPIERAPAKSRNGAVDEDAVAVANLDSDGQREVVMHDVSDRSDGTATLRVFEANGDLRFAFKMEAEVKYSELSAGPPFGIAQMLVPSGLKDAPILIGLLHHRWFPSMVLAVSPQGRVVSQYWSAGHVRTVATVQLFGARRIAAGGYSSDRKSASLAIVDPGAAQTVAPAEDAKYRCLSCGTAVPPLAFMVFPKSALAEQAEADPSVADVAQEPDGTIRVMVVHYDASLPGDRGPRLVADVYYRFDANLHLLDVELGTAFSQLEARAEALKILTRAAVNGERQRLSVVQVWRQDHYEPMAPVKNIARARN